jgi:hypothetical protein
MHRTHLTKAIWLAVLTSVVAASSLGCDDPAERQARAEAKARARAEAQAAEAAEARQAELTAKAERDKQALARQEEAAHAEKARGALGACCTALARRGFEQRSMKDMEAKRFCLEAEAKGDSLAAVRTSLQTPVGERGLPPACQAD